MLSIPSLCFNEFPVVVIWMNAAYLLCVKKAEGQGRPQLCNSSANNPIHLSILHLCNSEVKFNVSNAVHQILSHSFHPFRQIAAVMDRFHLVNSFKALPELSVTSDTMRSAVSVFDRLFSVSFSFWSHLYAPCLEYWIAWGWWVSWKRCHTPKFPFEPLVLDLHTLCFNPVRIDWNHKLW